MQQSSGHFFEFFHFIDDHSQCEDEGQGIGGRTGSEHTDNTHRLGQQQGDRDEKHDLSGQRDDGRLDRLADCLQVDGGDSLEPLSGQSMRKMRKHLTANSLYRPSSKPKIETTLIGANWKIKKAMIAIISEP